MTTPIDPPVAPSPPGALALAPPTASARRPPAPITGLVLTGGGARAAYQVGALRALAELAPPGAWPFPIIAGASAGAINGAALAASPAGFAAAVDHLIAVWQRLTPDKVYRTDAPGLLHIALQWLRDLSSGGAFGPPSINHLLDTAPLRALLARELDLANVAGHVHAGRLRGVAVTATNYHSGVAVSFFDGAPGIGPWMRNGRFGRRERLTLDHVLASASIPIFFAPVLIEGAYFGDGGIRLSAPLSPALHLGADRLLAICTHHTPDTEELLAITRDSHGGPVPVAQIGGILLDAAFMRSFDADVERAERINGTLALIPTAERARHRRDYPLRRVAVLALRPTRDIGRLAANEFERFPRPLRHLLRGIGATDQRGWDLLSYLAFEPSYVEALISLGYRDTLERRAELEAFLTAPSLDPDFVPA